MTRIGRCLALGLAMLLGACAASPAPVASAPAPAETIRAMSYNVRLDLSSDGANAWPHRRAMVAALIRHEAPDILGMQEVLLEQKRALEADLPAFAIVGVARDDGAEAGEFSPLAFRTARFELIEEGTFWLSPTPDTPGKAWDAALPRIATWAILRDRRSGRRLRALNTHFDHVGAAARANSAGKVAEWVRSGPGAGLPTIVMGDLNTAPGSEPYLRLTQAAEPRVADARAISRTLSYGPPGTFTGFDITRADPAPIDHVFVTDDFVVERHAVITQHWGGRLPSDHYPVLAELRLVP